MRIVHVINSLATGGAETLVIELVQEMSARGHEVKIVCLGRGAGSPEERAAAWGLDVTHLAESPYRGLRPLQLSKECRDSDIVHVHLFPALYLGAALDAPRVKLFTEHSTHNRRREHAVLGKLDRVAYERYDQVVAVSEGVRKSLSDYFVRTGTEVPVSIIQNGIAERFYRPVTVRHVDRKRLRIVSVGTLDDRKNFALAIRAVSMIPGAELVIVGRGPLEDELRAQIREYDAGSRIQLLGGVSNVEDHIDEGDLLLSTSRYEGVGLVAAEAMARGRPVVGPNVPGFRETVPHEVAGILFDPSHGVDAVVKAILRTAEVPARYRAMSRAARSEAERFRITKAVDQHLELYQEMLSRWRQR